jgi:TonB family protein
VTGTAHLRVEVGADGAVSKVNVVGPLPDLLTEEAIRAAYQMKFKPAMKNGDPVAFWQKVDVSFNLQ